MNSKPLLSIVIPTKNRQKYCISAIESILEFGNKDIQIVIQDNSDNSCLKDLIPKVNDENILKYIYIYGKLSFVENFNRAIDAADGEYICIIGDDDGINPEIIKATIWAKNNNVDSIVGNVEANYRWNNTGAKDTFFTKMTGSTLTVTHFTGKAKRVNIEDSLRQLMRNGCTNYLDYDFPKLYHGIVKKTALEKIKSLTGSYLKGLSPDIYASIALACTIDSLVVVDYPLTIPGVCAESGSIQEGQKKDHSKELSNAPHFKGRTEEYFWDDKVPKIYCVQTIWADSAFAALKEFNRKEDLLNYFDVYMLSANILDADPSLKEMVFNYLINYDSTLTYEEHAKAVKKAMLKGPFVKYIKARVLGRLKKILKIERFEIFTELPDMVHASKKLQEYLSKLPINLSKELEKV